MIPVPDLDTIAFDALVEEGRALIPRYAPGWTDHNLHDPGITLLDLLAWVIDQQIYRIGFVGDPHLRAFAALLGVHPEPAKPARGLLWPAAGPPVREQTMPAGTRASPAHQPELVFTTCAKVRLSPATIDTMTARSAGKTKRVRADSSGSIRLDAATDSLELDLQRPLFDDAAGEARLALGLEFAGALPDLGSHAAPAILFDYRTSDGAWHRADSRWIDGSARRSGVALIDVAAAHDVAALRLGFAASPVRTLPTRLAFNVLPVAQIESLAGIALGTAPGLPDLELSLGAGAIPAVQNVRNPLRISTREPGGNVAWRRVHDLGLSNPQDSDYIFDEARAVIRFGNAVNGRIPLAGIQINRAALDITAGAQGNLVAGLAWRVHGVSDDSAWKNLEAIAGGCDSWDRDTLLTALRRRSRARSAMLGDSELRSAAANLQGFGLDRAEVLPRFLPTLPTRSVPGARTLLLYPGNGVEGSDAWVDAIEARLAPRRVLGERLSVAAAEPVTIAVAADLLIASGSDAPSIEESVRAVLQARLSASRKSPEIDPWPSGRSVTIGEIEALVAGVEGVVAVPRLRLGGRGDPPEQVSVPLERIEVAVAGTIDLTLRVEA